MEKKLSSDFKSLIVLEDEGRLRMIDTKTMESKSFRNMNEFLDTEMNLS